MEITYEQVIAAQAIDIYTLRQELAAALRRIAELEGPVEATDRVPAISSNGA